MSDVVLSINTVIQAAALCLQQDASILAFLNTTFGNPAWGGFFVCEDVASPPRQDDAPYCVVSPAPVSYDVGSETETREPVIDIDWGIVQDKKTVTQNTFGPVTTCNGLAQVDALGQLILAAIINRFGPTLIRKANYMITPLHPVYDAGMTVTISLDQGFGEITSLAT